MTTAERTIAVGVFTERANADRAIEELHNAGFTNEQIGFITRGETPAAAPENAVDNVVMQGTDYVPPMAIPPVGPAPAAAPMAEAVEESSVLGQSRAESTAAGAVGGGVLGGVLGAAASLLIPGFGPAIAGGVLAATFGGVIIGAIAGGFVGALTQMGVPEEEARYYQDELNSGRTIVTVQAGKRYLDVLTILRRNGAYDASTRHITTEAGTAPTGSNVPGTRSSVAPAGPPAGPYPPQGVDQDVVSVEPAAANRPETDHPAKQPTPPDPRPPYAL